MKDNEDWDDVFAWCLNLVTFCVVVCIVAYVGYRMVQKNERRLEADKPLPVSSSETQIGDAAGIVVKSDDRPKRKVEYIYNRDIGIVAETLWSEARSEGVQGIGAVASVICNRSVERNMSVVDVCLEPMQFSCWNGVDVNDTELPIRSAEKRSLRGRTIWFKCLRVASLLVNGRFKPSNDANHYYNPKKCKPKWGDKLKDAFVVGRHRFGRI